MARMRSIKPEFWTDLKLARLSRDARLLYISLWNQADEHGRLHGDARYVKGHCLPYDDDLSLVAIDRLLTELQGAGRVQRYDFEGDPYLFLPRLAKHQRLEAEKVPSRLPAPPPVDETRRSEAHSESGADETARGADETESGATSSETIVALQVAGSREHVAGARTARTRPAVADTPVGFAEFWQAYPKRVGKKGAEKSYARALKAGATPAELLAGAQRYTQQVSGKDPEFVAHPQTWLNQGRWEDEPPQTTPGEAEDEPWWMRRGRGSA